MATQSFEKHGFRFVAGDIYTYCGSKGREWIAQRPGGGGWITRAPAFENVTR